MDQFIPRGSHHSRSPNPLKIRPTARTINREYATNRCFQIVQAPTESPIRDLLRKRFDSRATVNPDNAETQVHVKTRKLEDELSQQSGALTLQDFPALPNFADREICHSGLTCL